ncbi:MAG: ribonuclease HII [Alphaproteobacteria bacterium]|nr:ribonuclease HII [Alphaproteobacteria bacterium]MCL2890244.1 ribonuclease HII [Alphaproteobacteria bacterium]
MPNFEIENSCARELIAGVDEAGRGPLCGPVVAAAVIFLNHNDVNIFINDSKKMTAAARNAAYEFLTTNPNIIWAIGQCSPTEIDELNILHASMLAMKRAVDNLSTTPKFVLVDGNRMPPDLHGRAIIQGDSKSLSIAAASIIAKVTRDRIMQKLAAEFPEYGWDRNAGYPTVAHMAAIQKFGINEHYRKTFAPVKKIICA